MINIKEFRVDKIVLLISIVRKMKPGELEKYSEFQKVIQVANRFTNNPDIYKTLLEDADLMNDLSTILQGDGFKALYDEALEYRDEVAERWEMLKPTINDYYTNVLGLKEEKDILVNIVNPKFNTGTNNMKDEIFYAHMNGKKDISYDATYIMHESMHCLFPRLKEWTREQYAVCHALIELATDNELSHRLGGNNPYYNQGHLDAGKTREKLMPLWVTFLSQKGGPSHYEIPQDEEFKNYVEKAQSNNVQNMNFAELMEYCIEHYHEYGLTENTFYPKKKLVPNLLSNIKNELDSIESTELGRKRISFIRQIITQKDYDSTLIDENGVTQEALCLLMYEYGLGIEKITQGRCSLEKALEKLTNTMSKLRFGPWKDTDSIVRYGKGINDPNSMSVTSEEYKKATKNFGAHKCEYLDETDNYQAAVALLRTDLTNIDDVRHTLFHEWTHILEMSILNKEEFQKADIPLEYSNNGKTFVNGEKTQNNQYVFSGLSTAQILPNGDKVMHNMIDEGFVEEIAKRITIASGNQIFDEGRYKDETAVAGLLIDIIGPERFLTDFLMHSHTLKHSLETTKSGDILHKCSQIFVDIRDCSAEFQRLSTILPIETLKELQTHPFFKCQKYDETSNDIISNFKEKMTEAILNSKNPESLDTVLGKINTYIGARNNLNNIKNYLKDIRDQQKIKKEKDSNPEIKTE